MSLISFYKLVQFLVKPVIIRFDLLKIFSPKFERRIEKFTSDEIRNILKYPYTIEYKLIVAIDP